MLSDISYASADVTTRLPVNLTLKGVTMEKEDRIGHLEL